MREHFVVPSIGSREVAWAHRSGIGHGEDALKPLDFGNGLLSVHSLSIIQQKRPWVKRKQNRCFLSDSCVASQFAMLASKPVPSVKTGADS
jgi:hypothetical protein